MRSFYFTPAELQKYEHFVADLQVQPDQLKCDENTSRIHHLLETFVT